MCLSKDVTGHCSFYCIAIPSSLSLPDFLFSLSHSVSVQRRDRLLFFLLHCYTKAPHFTRFIRFLLTLLPPSWIFVCAIFSQCVCPKTWQVLCFPFWSYSIPLLPLLSSVCAVCLSKDVTGTLFPSLICLACPFLFSAALFWLHSVSVQRRDRCSATYTTHLCSF